VRRGHRYKIMDNDTTGSKRRRISVLVIATIAALVTVDRRYLRSHKRGGYQQKSSKVKYYSVRAGKNSCANG